MKLARSAALPESKQSDAGIVATELATNLTRHATAGQVWLQVLVEGAHACVEIVAVDAGPGIPDVRRSLQDGYSTAGTAGTGLGAVRRLSSTFDLYSQPGQGTVVMSRLQSNGNSDQSVYMIGAVSLPAPHETICGDSWRIVEKDRAVAVMVADGLGHGPLAAEAANQAADVFTTAPFAEASTFYGTAHQNLRSGRGAAVARALVLPSGRLAYSGVGNISGSLLGADGSRGLPSQNGTVGAEMRRVTTAEYDWPPRGLLLMHSDGLTARWSLDRYPGLVVRHPGVVAAVMYRDFVRGRDDATVVAVARRAA